MMQWTSSEQKDCSSVLSVYVFVFGNYEVMYVRDDANVPILDSKTLNDANTGTGT